MLGNKTLIKGIRLLPPASMLICDLKEKKVKIEKYWDFKPRLENRSGYGSYIVGFSTVVIYDENGDLLYDKTHSFTLSGFNLIMWITVLLISISTILLLDSDFRLKIIQ